MIVNLNVKNVVAQIRTNHVGGKVFTYNECETLECCLRTILASVWWKLSIESKANIVAAIDQELDQVRRLFSSDLELAPIFN
jgi:hypothetical protein